MKKRMILALVLVIALLCLACANDADNGASSSEGGDRDNQSVSVAETGTESSVDSTSSTDGTSAESTSGTDETSAESGTSGTSGTNKDTSGVGTSGTSSSDTSNASSSADNSTSGDTSNASSNANGTSSASTSNGTESSATSSDTSTSSKPAENSESSKPAEGSENGGSVDTSGNTDNPSQTVHTHKYAATIINPTCTEDGYTLHECSCGDSYTDNEVPATGHEMGYWTIRNVKECSYSEPGIKERPCNRCGEWLVDNEYYHYWAPPVNDEEEVYRRIIALKEIYPHGSSWDGDTYYDARYDAWGNLIKQDDFEGWGVTDGYGSADACMGFAAMVSNTVFGVFWGHRTLPKGTFTIKDVRVGDLIYFENHVAVALEVHDDYIITVDGNNCGDVCWGDENGLLSAIFSDYLESSCYIETRYDPVCF